MYILLSTAKNTFQSTPCGQNSIKFKDANQRTALKEKVDYMEMVKQLWHQKNLQPNAHFKLKSNEKYEKNEVQTKK